MTLGHRIAMDATSTAAGRLQETLPGCAYLDEDVYGLEVDRILLREWLCVGREETIPEPGDFLNVDVAGESLLIVRTRRGELRALYNVCRHRGSRLVMEAPTATPDRGAPCASGRFKGAIRCPYHAWTYGLEGELRNAPYLDERHGLLREQLPLHRAGVEVWGGFIFVNLDVDDDGDAPGRRSSFADQLGAVAERTRRYPLAELRTAERITYDVAANWKVILENYNECYHCGPVHPELCEIVPAFKEGGAADLDWDRGVPHREGAYTFTATGRSARPPFPGLNDDERTRHKGELVYPNLMISLASEHVAAYTLAPDGPGRTVVQCDWLFAPEEIERPSFDASDAVEFWDLINRQDWQICESVQRGMSSRVFRRGYYAPMEDLSNDIRRYLRERLGDAMPR
jgi:Rieske 2Fe-2S family protein